MAYKDYCFTHKRCDMCDKILIGETIWMIDENLNICRPCYNKLMKKKERKLKIETLCLKSEIE